MCAPDQAKEDRTVSRKSIAVIAKANHELMEAKRRSPQTLGKVATRLQPHDQTYESTPTNSQDYSDCSSPRTVST